MNTQKYKLRERCSKLLKSKSFTEDDFNFLHSILELHSNYDKKVGVGIDYFFVKRTPYGNLGFCIMRLDGTSTDFSFYRCITNPSKHGEIRKSCRTAVYDSIKSFRQLSGTIIHHDVIPFEEIVKNWLFINPDIDLSINDTQDNLYKVSFKNSKTANSFKLFHDKVAVLKEVTINEHKQVHYGKKSI